MSSAANHRKRSHRSQKKHYEANTRRWVRSEYRRIQKENPGLLKKFFGRMFRGKSGEI